MDRVSVDPARLEAVDERLRLYTDLGRKYGGSTEAAVAYLEEATARLAALERARRISSRLEESAAAQQLRGALELAARSREARREAAPLLEQAVAAQLADLGMPSAAHHRRLCRPARAGRACGRAAPTRWSSCWPPTPASRRGAWPAPLPAGSCRGCCLAIKCALAGAGGDETLVFDEIDAGIGGRTAVAVAQQAARTGRRSQVMVVTHLAQVAALAARHYLIEKSRRRRRGRHPPRRLEGEAVVEELCRMMGGSPDDAEAMAHARDLRDRAAAGLLD